ncbi:polysaccharide pyruvyl transferase family protein [Prosthecomicrobium sp. N25]|uniref:polysaccharide pyruvyl transferase family protein n=1 Tax=Prosthecomicrobium sp. N25 TaxID=3129254 RepID=UPI003077E9E6
MPVTQAGRSPPPVGILFANLKGNVGDFAILHAMLRDLEARFPGHPLHVYPHRYLSRDATRLSAFRDTGTPPFEILGPLDAQPRPAWHQTLSDRGYRRLARALAFQAVRQEARPVARTLGGYAGVFTAGGDQWNGFIGLTMLATLKAVAARTDRIWAYPFSINPRARRSLGDALLGRHLGLIRRPLPVRDTISAEVARDLGLETADAGDCVYSLLPLARLVPPARGRGAGRTLLVLTGSAKPLEAALGAAVARLLPAIPDLALLSTCDLEDGPVCRPLAAAQGIPYLTPLTWQETVAELKAASLVVTNRLHCLIFSTLADVPVLPIADRKKAEAYVRDANMPHHAATIADLTPDRLEAARSDRCLVVSRMVAYRTRMLNLPTSPLGV